MCKIIEYTDRYKTPLRTFLRNTYPTYSEEYLDYIVNSISDQRPSLLIINDDDEIVGGHHYYCTKALVNGVIIDTFWGHDTYIKQEYRKEIGLDFILTVHSIPGFGIGLTDINKEISKKIGKTFFSGVFTYYTINWKIVFSPILKLFEHSPKIDDRDVNVCGNIFRKINDGRIPYIPNDGFWYKGYKDIDFIRNADFLEKRFFANNVYKYHFYYFTNNDTTCYFTVRISSYRNMHALCISDFRYDPKRLETIGWIMKAVHKLALRSNIGIILFVCGDENVTNYYKHKFHYKSEIDFVTELNIRKESSFSVCGADSDADFLKR